MEAEGPRSSIDRFRPNGEARLISPRRLPSLRRAPARSSTLRAAPSARSTRSLLTQFPERADLIRAQHGCDRELGAYLVHERFQPIRSLEGRPDLSDESLRRSGSWLRFSL